MIGLVYQQNTPNETSLCIQSKETLQTLDQLRKIGNNVCEQYKHETSVDAKTLGIAFQRAGWNNSVAFPKYDDEDYWSWPSGQQPQILHTGAGISFATWANDTQNQTIDVVNAVWKGDGTTGKIKYFINLYEDRYTGEKRVLVKMPVNEIEWSCDT